MYLLEGDRWDVWAFVSQIRYEGSLALFSAILMPCSCCVPILKRLTL